MKDVDYTDDDGRLFRVRVPDDCPEHMWRAGIPLGPPDLDSQLAERGWPESARIRLHNQLHQRGLFTLKEALRNIAGLEAALKAALKTDVQTLQALYYEEHGPPERGTRR